MPDSSGQQEFWSIGDLAAELSVSPRAIRLYEEEGLLAPKRAGGNRIYSYRDRARLRLVLRGKRLGFSLADIKELLDLYNRDEENLVQLKATLGKTRGRLGELEQQRKEIDALVGELTEIERHLASLVHQKESQRGHK
jgi:DNA-binding transcriptional MerR regulator